MMFAKHKLLIVVSNKVRNLNLKHLKKKVPGQQ